MQANNQAKLVSDHDQLVPRALLLGMAALVLFALSLTVYAVTTNRAPSAPHHATAPVQTLMIQIKDRGDGGTLVTDMEGQTLFDYPATERGFITVVRNALDFNRKKARITTNPPIALIRFADGRIGLRDDASGWKINLVGFGQDNARHWNAVLAGANG